jgi:hypothetical protein
VQSVASALLHSGVGTETAGDVAEDGEPVASRNRHATQTKALDNHRGPSLADSRFGTKGEESVMSSILSSGRRDVRYVAAGLTVAAIATAASVALAAGAVSSATVTALTLEDKGTNRATVTFTPALSNPACNISTILIFDYTTTKGKSFLNLLTAAQLSGKKVTLTGTGTCTTISGLTWETLASVQMY